MPQDSLTVSKGLLTRTHPRARAHKVISDQGEEKSVVVVGLEEEGSLGKGLKHERRVMTS